MIQQLALVVRFKPLLMSQLLAGECRCLEISTLWRPNLGVFILSLITGPNPDTCVYILCIAFSYL